jgi:hypothetical protein
MPHSPISNLVGQYFNSSSGTLTGTAETSVFPAGVGSLTIPGDWFRPGYNARLIVRGSVNTPLIAGTSTIRLKAAGNTIASATTSSLLGSLSGPQQFAVIVNLQCYTAGVSGNFGIGGEVRYPVGLAGIQVGSIPLFSSGTAINSAANIPIDITSQWSLTAHSLSVSIATLELMSM